MNQNLGRGQFGQVKRCYHMDRPEVKYACKLIVKSHLNDSLHTYLKNEIALLRSLNSENLIGLHHIDKTENNYYLIFDICNGGDMLKLLQIRKKFKEEEALKILK